MEYNKRNLYKNFLKSLVFILLIVLINCPFINNYYAFSANENLVTTVYGGGFPVGLSIQSDGVLVLGRCEVLTSVGRVVPRGELASGDIIKSINDYAVKSISDIQKSLIDVSTEEKAVKVNIVRCGISQIVDAYPIKEEYSNEYKLGIFVRDNIAGVGTMTFIKSNGDFACLGHPICDHDTQTLLPCLSGDLYNCSIVGFDKGIRGKPGGLKGQIIGNGVGKISKNCKFGVYGKINNLKTANFGELKKYQLQERKDVKIGKAKILTTIDDVSKEYEIEIIRCFNQNAKNDKSMVIRVTDAELLNKTGGIIQGMSGSPILQDNKIVGAVTHVFVNDPTKGYGIYADWMNE